MSTDQCPATGSHHRLPFVRRLLAVTATIAALAMLAPMASATSEKSFHIAKICVPDGTSCTVTESNYGPIRTGTTISYVGESFDALVATVHVNGGTATGNCDIAAAFDVDGHGECVFTGGSGPLGHFDVTLAVTFVDLFSDETSLWSWDWTGSPGNGD